jgi:hypothetical protein
MLPAFLLVGVGTRRRVWLPIPVFILWPFWLLGWPVWLAFRIVGFRWAEPLKLALVVGAHLSGTRVDIDASDGEQVHIRMV